MGQRSQLPLKLGVLLGSVSASLLLTEIALSQAGYTPYFTAHSYAIVEHYPELRAFCDVSGLDDAVATGLLRGPLGDLKEDPDLGYTFFSGPVLSGKYVANRQGFNDRKDFTADYRDETRVLVLGDSFTEGASADAGRGYVDLLNLHYAARHVTFFNTGVGGYSQSNQLAVLERYTQLIRPHLVLLGFFPANDFDENVQPLDRYSGFPRHWIGNYEVIIDRDSTDVRRRSPDERLRLYQRYIGCETPPAANHSLTDVFREELLLETRLGTQLWLAGRAIGRSHADHRTAAPALRPDGDAAEAHRSAVTREYLDAIQRLLEQLDIPLVVVLIPDYRPGADTLTQSPRYQRGLELLEELHIHHIDLFDDLALRDYGAPEDIHWTNTGHEIAFRRVARYLDGTLPSTPDADP